MALRAGLYYKRPVMTRANLEGLAGRRWPAGRQLPTPALSPQTLHVCHLSWHSPAVFGCENPSWKTKMGHDWQDKSVT